jgi:hypothetical protein
LTASAETISASRSDWGSQNLLDALGELTEVAHFNVLVRCSAYLAVPAHLDHIGVAHDLPGLDRVAGARE